MIYAKNTVYAPKKAKITFMAVKDGKILKMQGFDMAELLNAISKLCPSGRFWDILERARQ